MSKIITYAQNREDLILNELLKDVQQGYYVDVGANHSTVDSVTKLFYDKGWRGINIEPSPGLYSALSKDRPRDINLNVGISSEKGNLLFREYIGSGLSTFSKIMKDQYSLSPDSNTKDFKDYLVEVLTLEQVLEKYLPNGKIIDFLKVDVEGFEYEVLVGNNWKKFRPKVICIEANHVNKEWSQMLIDSKYLKVFNDGLNDYYVAEEHRKIFNKFYYPNILLGPQVVTYPNSLEISLLEDELRASLLQSQKLELDNQIINEKIYPLKYQIGVMNDEIQKNKRLRSQLVNLAKTIDTIILLQLNKLNNKHTAISVRQHNKSDMYSGETIEELRKKAWIEDINNLGFGSIKTVESKSLPYRMILGVYVLSKRISKMIARKMWHIVKKIEGRR